MQVIILGGGVLSYIIFAFGVTYLIFTVLFSIKKSFQTGSWKKPHSPKRTQRYIKEKIILANKYCNDLPAIDSRGIYGGVSGSFTDKTGKINPSYLNEMKELNESYGIRSE